jgi:hypothetical protein
MHIVHFLLLAIFAWFALSTVYVLSKMLLTTQDHFFGWVTKKIARAGSWADQLVIGGMVAAPALLFAWTKFAH